MADSRGKTLEWRSLLKEQVFNQSSQILQEKYMSMKQIKSTISLGGFFYSDRFF